VVEILRSGEGETAQLEVVGELDIASGPTLDAAVGEALEDGAREVVIDLGRTTFVDSAGLGALIRVVRTVDQEHASMSVVSPPGSEARLVIEMARVGGVVGLRDP
jgi:anti-sigma B factor antagonist